MPKRKLTEEQQRQFDIQHSIDVLFEAIVKGAGYLVNESTIIKAVKIFKKAVSDEIIEVETLRGQLKERARYHCPVGVANEIIDELMDTVVAEIEEMPLLIADESALVRKLSVARLKEGI